MQITKNSPVFQNRRTGEFAILQLLYQLIVTAAAVVVGRRGRIAAVLASVKGRIECVEVLAVQPILSDAQRFTETGRLK